MTREMRSRLDWLTIYRFACTHVADRNIEPTSRNVAAALKIDWATVRTRNSTGRAISAYEADRCATALGHHPSEIWGSAWWEACDADHQRERDLAARRQQLRTQKAHACQ